jgi:hypothetical protein
MLGRTTLGRWAAFEFAELVARQNGKGEILLARALAGLYLFDETLILHSAHEFKTAAEAFLRIKAVIDGAPHLSKLVKAMPSSHGNEGVELTTGQRLRFMARSGGSGRGFTGDTILLDEAQQLPRKAVGAMLPTLSARPNPQVCYFGTVPTPENDSEHWTSVRDRGRSGNDATLAWLEWSAGLRCDDMDDRELWIASNPALGYRISEEAIARERNALPPESFLAERLSVWPEFSSKAVIDPHDWLSCRAAEQYLTNRDPEWMGRPVCFAVEVDPGRMWASIAAAGPCIEGGTALDIVDHRREGPQGEAPHGGRARRCGCWCSEAPGGGCVAVRPQGRNGRDSVGGGDVGPMGPPRGRGTGGRVRLLHDRPQMRRTRCPQFFSPSVLSWSWQGCTSRSLSALRSS